MRKGMIVALVLLLGTFQEVVAVPNIQRITIGWEEYQRTGKCLSEIHFTSPMGIDVVFPIWDLPGENPSVVRIYGNQYGLTKGLQFSSRPQATSAGNSPPITSSLFQRQSLFGRQSLFSRNFDFGRSNLLPLHGEVYKVTLEDKGGRLDRVTQQVPTEFRPKKDSRILSMVESEQTIFWKNLQSDDPVDYDSKYEYYEVKIVSIDTASKIAQVRFTPWATEVAKREIDQEKNVLVGKLEIGDLLALQGRAYRVLNIVPKQKVRGVPLTPVGWVELSANPVVPTPEDKIATLHAVGLAKEKPTTAIHQDPQPLRLSPNLVRRLKSPWTWLVVGCILIIGGLIFQIKRA